VLGIKATTLRILVHAFSDFRDQEIRTVSTCFTTSDTPKLRISLLPPPSFFNVLITTGAECAKVMDNHAALASQEVLAKLLLAMC